MNMKLLFAPVALLIASASPADPQPQADLRCLVASLALSGNDNAALSRSGLMGAVYFLGKVDGELPGADLEPMLRKEAANISQQEERALLQKCGTELKQRGEYLQAIGKGMEKPAAT